MKVVGKFKLGRNIYVIVLKNNKYRVGRLEGNLVNYNLSDEEKKAIMVVLDKLLPKDDGIKITSLKINNIVYDISVSNNIFMFNPVPNENDLKVLNNIFNGQSEYMFVGSFFDKDSKFIKRFVKLGKKTLLVLLSSTMVLSMSSSLKSDVENQFNNESEMSQEIDDNKLIAIIEEPEIKYEEPEVVEIDELPTEVVEEIQDSFDKEEAYSESENIEVFNFDDIVEAVNNNPNLTQEEKDMMLSNKKIYEDNYGYYNYDNLLNLLNTVKVNYIPEIGKVGGTYCISTNVMEVYGGTCFEEIKKSAFTHEFSHLIQNTNPNCGTSFFDEGINAIANHEYYHSEMNNEGSYPFQRGVVRALDLIIGGDVFRKYYTNKDLNAIITELYKIYPDERKADEFISLIRCYQTIFFSYMFDLELESYNFDKTMDEVAELILQDLSFYYETKFGRNVESDLIMLFFVNTNLFYEKIVDMYGVPLSDVYYVILHDMPSIVDPDGKNKVYSFSILNQNIIGYTEESYEDCLNGGLIGENGEPLYDGLIVDKENNKVLRPRYDMKEMLITIDENSRYVINLNR